MKTMCCHTEIFPSLKSLFASNQTITKLTFLRKTAWKFKISPKLLICDRKRRKFLYSASAIPSTGIVDSYGIRTLYNGKFRYVTKIKNVVHIRY